LFEFVPQRVARFKRFMLAILPRAQKSAAVHVSPSGMQEKALRRSQLDINCPLGHEMIRGNCCQSLLFFNYGFT
jgi:hypothetical protein